MVDDDVRNVFALTSALEQKGALVEIARNGPEAIDKLQHDETIDPVLMDIMMPEMDGFTAMQEIRKEARFAAADHRGDRQGDEGRSGSLFACRRQRLPPSPSTSTVCSR